MYVNNEYCHYCCCWYKKKKLINYFYFPRNVHLLFVLLICILSCIDKKYYVKITNVFIQLLLTISFIHFLDICVWHQALQKKGSLKLPYYISETRYKDILPLLHKLYVQVHFGASSELLHIPNSQRRDAKSLIQI